MKDGKMVATLNGTETMIYNMIRGEFNSSFISLPVPQEEKAVINLEIFYARRPQIKIKLTEQGAVVDLELRFEGNVLGGGTTIDYALSEDRVILEEAVAKSLKREVEKLVAKSQALGSDILEFGLNARRLVKTVDEWNNLNWDVLFMNSQVNVKVDFKIRRTSTLFKHAPITTEIVGEGEE